MGMTINGLLLINEDFCSLAVSGEFRVKLDVLYVIHLALPVTHLSCQKTKILIN